MITHEINLKIHEESDLFSPVDQEQQQLSDDVLSCISRNYLVKHKNNKEKYVIHIYSDMPVDEKNVREKIRTYYQQEKKILYAALKKLTLKEIFLGALGIIILAVWLYLSARTENVNIEVLSIVGWVAVWEAASIAIMERPGLILLIKSCGKMIDSEIVIHLGTR